MEYGDNIQQLKLEIHTAEDTFTWNGFVDPESPQHIRLSHPEGDDYGGICLHDLKRWVDENVFGSGTAG